MFDSSFGLPFNERYSNPKDNTYLSFFFEHGAPKEEAI